jgi:hypothetical protein
MIRAAVCMQSATEPKLKLLEGHVEAEPVLTALMEQASAEVRKMARQGLRRIRYQKCKAP